MTLEVPNVPRTPVPDWQSRFPWLVAGTTGRFPAEDEPNFGLYTELPAQRAMASWAALMDSLEIRSAVHARQVHEAEVRVHETVRPSRRGLWVLGPGDGHATTTEGVLLTVTTADCVPVFMVDPQVRAIALLHAGWRGTAAGILEAGLAVMRDRLGADESRIHVHLGPAICGDCYEVGPEVFEALKVPLAEGLDLRRVLEARAKVAGVEGSRITRSDACTRTDEGLFSHRGGDRGRQIAYLAIGEATPAVGEAAEGTPNLAAARSHAGLCASCRWARVVRSDKGSVFFLCSMSRHDPSFPKYPRLPVVDCPAFDAVPQTR